MSVIKLNPAVVHLMDGDFDGDQVCIILPLSKESQQDLINMDVYKFIRENSDHFKPKKEFEKYKPESWDLDNFDILNHQINEVYKKSTNGQSISYHDLYDDEKNDGYFNNLNINKNELKKIANGIYEDELINGDENISISGAVRSYKLIKQNVAQFGALANAILTLTVYSTWDLPFKEKQKYLDLAAKFKHILCQDGLSAKHGNNKLNSKNSKILQDMFYRTPDNKLETKDEYKNVLLEIGLTEEIVNFVLNLFWREPLIGINKLLDNLSPTFRITRRGSDISLLDNMVICKDEKSLNSRMLIGGNNE